jgi:hypothetical protein
MPAGVSENQVTCRRVDLARSDAEGNLPGSLQDNSRRQVCRRQLPIATQASCLPPQQHLSMALLQAYRLKQ